MFNFEKLEVWQEAINFADTVYTLTRTFPETERFGLTNQMRRAAVSISSTLPKAAPDLPGRISHALSRLDRIVVRSRFTGNHFKATGFLVRDGF